MIQICVNLERRKEEGGVNRFISKIRRETMLYWRIHLLTGMAEPLLPPRTKSNSLKGWERPPVYPSSLAYPPTSLPLHPFHHRACSGGLCIRLGKSQTSRWCRAGHLRFRGGIERLDEEGMEEVEGMVSR